MERCILVQLVNRRDELVEKYKAQPDRKFRQTAKAKNQLRPPRADGLGLSRDDGGLSDGQKGGG